MFQTFLKKLKIIFTDKIILSKIIFVLLMFIVFRLLGSIPLPGINTAQLVQFLDNNQFFAFLSLFSGGGLTQLSLVALGVAPFITSSIIMQLMTILVPRMKSMYHEEGEAGRKKFNQYSRFLSIAIGIVQAIGLVTLLSSQSILTVTSPFQMVLLVVTMVAGSTLVMWIGELISEFGVGNGISMIVFAGIVSRIPGDISKAMFSYNPSQLPLYIAIFAIIVLMIFISVIITEAERPIPVHYAKQVRAGYQTGGTDTYIPLRIAQAGVMPIIFAGSILQMPQILSFFLAKSTNATLTGIATTLKNFTSTNIWYMIIYFIMIFFFTYFYTAVTFDAESMANNLQKNGAFVPGVRPGAATAEYVATLLSRTTFFGAIFFSVIAVMPFILQKLTGNSLFAIGGTGILIGVSVCTDLIKKLGAQASMREY
jgi:preprotein translocase subunit SecY